MLDEVCETTGHSRKYANRLLTGSRRFKGRKGRGPTDVAGKFSLALSGDLAFEKSKTDALAELEAENKNRREGGADARRNAEALGVRTIRIADVADENAKRRNAGRNYSRLHGLADENAAGRARTPMEARGADGTANGAVLLANAIQAVLSADSLTPEAKNAAIAAIAAANTPSCGSLSQQNAPVFPVDKLPQIAS